MRPCGPAALMALGHAVEVSQRRHPHRPSTAWGGIFCPRFKRPDHVPLAPRAPGRGLAVNHQIRPPLRQMVFQGPSDGRDGLME